MAAATLSISNGILSRAVAQRPAPPGRTSSLQICNAFCRPASFRQQRARCAPSGSCGTSPGYMGIGGPMGFSGRPLTQSDIENMMRIAEKFWGNGKAPERTGSSKGAPPSSSSEDMPLAVDVTEEDDAFIFTADVPGVARSDVKVQARKEERELVITGERPAPKRTDGLEGQSRSRIERRFGKFSRTFTLPDNAELTSISARFNNGVLIVSVPKIARKEPEVTDVPIDDYLDFNSAQ